MKKMILTMMTGLMMGLGALTVPTASYAAVPQVIPYQGQLNDSTGVPINGTTNIIFSLYSTATGGTAIWTETHTGVNISKGLFKVDMGSVSGFPVGTFSTPVWLGVTVGGDGEMSPRTPLNSAPFALHADDADTVGGASVSQLDQSAHVADTNNPHGVTAAQVGADAAGAAAAVQTALTVHTGNTANPHSVTAAQVGADAAGAAAAVQTALTAHTGNTANPHNVTAAQTSAVAKAGDTMTGALNLPSNGLIVGTNQLATSGGNVGVGTATPTQKLEVNGGVKLGAVATCGTAAAGTIRFDATTSLFEGCDGTNWRTFTSTTSRSTSVLATSAQFSQINSWIGTPAKVWTLCYRKSLDGALPSTFHTNCDGKGPTVTIAKLSTGKLVGGYNSVSWTSTTGYGGNSNSFLFSLTNNFKHAWYQNGFYVYNKSTYGPTFGGGHDLFFGTPNIGTGGYCNLGYAYQCRVGTYTSATCRNDFCGTYNGWTVTDLEVWY